MAMLSQHLILENKSNFIKMRLLMIDFIFDILVLWQRWRHMYFTKLLVFFMEYGSLLKSRSKLDS